MAIVSDEAYVLRSLRYGETSRIVDVFGRRHGRLHLIAKGARDPKSPFGAALEELTEIEISFYLKPNRELHFLRQATILGAPLGLLTRPRRYHLASAAAEFIRRVLTEADPAPSVYALLGDFLARLEQTEQEPCGDGGLKAFQLRAVALLGYAPQLGACVGCGAAITAPAGFAVAEGGVHCARCRSAGESLALSPGAWLRLRRLTGAAPPAATATAGPAPGRGPAESEQAEARQVARVIEAFLRYHVPRYEGLRALRSLGDWMQLRRDRAQE